MNVITTRFVAALLTLTAAIISAPSGADYSIAYGDGARAAGDDRPTASLQAEWLEMMREFPLGSTISLGLGVHLGGAQLERRTVASPASIDGRDVDPNHWLSLDARLEFHDIQPYARLRYRRGREDRGFGLRVDAGLRLLMVHELSVDLGGPLAGAIADPGRLLEELERELREDLNDYYVEALIRVEMNYRFG